MQATIVVHSDDLALLLVVEGATESLEGAIGVIMEASRCIFVFFTLLLFGDRVVLSEVVHVQHQLQLALLVVLDHQVWHSLQRDGVGSLTDLLGELGQLAVGSGEIWTLYCALVTSIDLGAMLDENRISLQI